MNSRVHGIIDYGTGLLLLLVPYLLGFANGGPEQLVPQVLGALTIGMSLVTAYEFSIVKLIPYRVHLMLDLAQAALLLLSPWLFGFAERIWWPHVLVAVIELVVIGLSWRQAAAR